MATDGRAHEGQIAVVTGAAQGLGFGIAHHLAQGGAQVVMVDLQGEKVNAAAAEVTSAGGQARGVCVDVTRSEQVKELFRDVVQRDGKIDVLINNAGLGQDVAAITELSDEHWQQVIDVTLTGTFFCCRSAGRWMRRQESGAIVNISSINGVNPAALVAAYNVAKSGVISLTRTLALELAAYGVRVNAVCPGPVYTDFNQRVMAQRCESLGITEEEMIERVRQAIPLGRWGEPGDIANAVGFLCSRSAAWMTGEVVRVSGGLEGVSAAPPKQPLPEADL